MPGNADGSITIDTELDSQGFDKGSDKLYKAIHNLTDEVDGFGDKMAQDFRDAGHEAQKFGSNISDAVKSSDFTREMSAAGRACDTLSTQLSRITDSARAGFNTDAQVVRFQSAVEKARDTISRMQSQLAALSVQQVSTTEYEELAAEAQKAEKSLFDLYERRDVMEQLGTSESSREWQRLAILIENAEYKLNNYERAMAGARSAGTAFQSGGDTEQYKKTAADLARMSEKLSEYEEMAARFDTVSSPAKQSERALKDVDAELKRKPKDTQKASGGFRQFGNVLKSVALTALRMMGVLAQLSLRAVAAGAKAAGNGFKAAARGIKNFTARANNASMLSKGLVKQLTSLKTMLVSKIKSAFITTVWDGAKKSLQELAKFSSSFNTAMSNMQNSAKGLSANLAVSLGGFIKTLEPVLTPLVDMLSRAITYMNAFFAAMQGKTTMIVAKKQTDSYAQSLDGAAESAKELKNQVYGFDELNKRSENTASGGSSSDLYEEVPIDSILPNELADTFDAVGDAVASENWSSLGEMLADGLGAALSSVDDFINNTLRPMGAAWAARIAEMLNGLVDGFDWARLGKTIADGINALADVANTFLTSFNFDNLGIGIGRSVNSLFDNVEWDLLGQTFANQWNALIDFVHGFVATVDFSNIGDSIARLFDSFFFTVNWNKAADTISSGLGGITASFQHFMDGVDWRSIGSTIGGALDRLGNNVDLNKVGTAIATGLNNIVYIIDGFITSIDFGGHGAAIADGFDSIFSTVDWGGIADGIDAAISGLFDFVNNFLTNLDWDALGAHLGDFINSLDIDAWLSDFGAFVSDLLISGADLCIGLIRGIDWGKLTDALVNGLGGMLAAINFRELVEKAFEFLGAAVGAAASIVATLALDIWELLKGAWEAVKGYFGDYIDSFGGDIVAGLWEGIKNAFINVGTWIVDNIFTPFINGFKAAFGIHSPSTEMKEMGVYIVDGLLAGVEKTWSAVTGFFSDSVDSIKTTLSDSWESVKTTASKKWGEIKSTVSSLWDGLKTKLSDVDFTSIGKNLVTGLKNGISNAWSTLKDTVGKLATGLTDTVKGLFGIKSPSRVWAQIGENLDRGLENGLDGKKKDVISTVSGIARDMNGAIYDNLSSAGDEIELRPDAEAKSNIESSGLVAALSGISLELSRIAAIGNALSGVGALRIPIVASGSEAPYKTRISDIDVSADTPDTAQSLYGDQLELLYDNNYLMRQLVDIVKKLRLNIDAESLSRAVSAAQKNTLRSYGGV